VTLAAVGLNRLKAFKVDAKFAPQVPLNYILTLLDRIHDLGELLFIELFRANCSIHFGSRQNIDRIRRAKPINVPKRNIDPLLAGNVYTQNTWHTCACLLALTLLVARI
jgi:hypothetical protein